MGSRRRVLVLALQIRTMGALIFIGGNVFGHIILMLCVYPTGNKIEKFQEAGKL